MIASRSFSTTPGANVLFHPSLTGVEILGVKRTGLAYNKTVGTPTNQQYQYIGGRIIFDTTIPFNPGEIVWVLFQN